MKKLILILIFSTSLLFANIGKVTALSGEAFVQKSSAEAKLSLGYTFDKKDTIYTKLGKVQLTFKDNTVITLGKNSKLSIEEYLYSEKKESSAKFKFAKGLFKTITGKIGKKNPEKFLIQTKTATIGIRGTIFRVAVLTPPKLPGLNIPQPQLESSQTQVQVDQGAVSVTNNLGQDVLIGVGEAVEVNVGGEIKPIPSLPMAVDELVVTPTAEEEAVEEVSPAQEEDSGTPAPEEEAEDEQSPSTPAAQEILPSEEGEVVASVVPTDSLETMPEVEPEFIPETPEVVDVTPDVVVEEVAEVVVVVEDTVEQINEDTEEVDIVTEVYGDEDAPDNPTSGDSTLDTWPPVAPTDAQQVTYYEDSYLSLGYWENSDSTIDSPWISQNILTDTDNIINNYMLSEVTATYTGDILAVQNGKLGTGDFSLDIDFGNQNISGDMSFQVEGEAAWELDVSGVGTVYASGFSADISSQVSSEVTNVTGSLEGSYLGDNAQAIGGTFSVSGDGGNSATGVFGGVQQ